MLRPKRDVYGNMLPSFLPSWKEIPDETLAGRVNIERDRFLSPLPFGRKRCERKRRKEGKEESEGREKSRGSRMREKRRGKKREKKIGRATIGPSIVKVEYCPVLLPK